MSKKPVVEIDPIDIAVGARMRMRRKSLGLTQSDMAQALKVTFQQIQKYERGANRISASMLHRAAARLDCSVGFLLGEGPEAMANDSVLLAALAEPNAIDALMAFNRIRQPQARAAVLTLMRELAGEGEAAA